MNLPSLFIKLIALVISFVKGIGAILTVIMLLSICFQISTIPIYLWDSGLVSYILFPIVVGMLYYFNTLIPLPSNPKFRFRIRQKLIVILFLTLAIILPGKLLIPGFYDGLRSTTFFGMIIFCYEEFRRSYLLNKSGLFWHDYRNTFTEIMGDLFEPIILFLLYSSVALVMNPFFVFKGITKGTWIIIDMLTITFLWISLLKDFKIGAYLEKEYLLAKEIIENKNVIDQELKLFVCENYSVGSDFLTKANYSSENPQLELQWSEKEKSLLGIQTSKLFNRK